MTKTGKSQQSSAAHRVIKSNIKNPWSKAEDAILSDSVRKYGPRNWQHIANQLETVRSAKQCRERYHNHLTGCVVKGNWTQEEDNVILKVQSSFGNQWAQITRLLPGRTDNAVKNRFHALVRASQDKNIDNNSNNIGDDATTMCDTNTVSNYTSSNYTSAATSNMTISSNTIATNSTSSSAATSITFDSFEPHPPSQLEIQQQLLPITAKNLEMLQMQHNYGMFSSNTSFSSGSVVSTASDEVIILCNNHNNNSNNNYNSNSNCINNNNNSESYNSSNNNEYYNYSGNNSSCSISNSISSAEYMIECEILDYLATELLCDKL